MLLFLISFVAGALTVLAPCILPLLPVVIGGSLSGDSKGVFNKKKAFTIIISLGLSVIIFTLLLKVSTLFIGIPEYVWKWISGGIVILLGIITIFPSLWESQFIASLSARSNILLGKGDQKNNFYGDIIVGASLGPIFSTCSPTYFIVLATVLPVSLFLGLIYLFSYTIGLCLALFVVSIVGQKIVDKLGIVADSRSWFKRSLGIVFLLVGIAIIGGLDKKVQIYLLDAGIFDVTKIEQKLLEKNVEASDEFLDVNIVKNLSEDNIRTNQVDKQNQIESTQYLSVTQKNSKYRKVVELSSIDGYINTNGQKITLESLKGKVVLLDIWTYSCINCQRTIPYINTWYAKYKNQGLEVVGLHTPEFAFEKIEENVEKAVNKFGIIYPVVMDNDYSTWSALGNQYWPRKYLIDVDGYIIYDHIGEGAYEETERAIQYALKERLSRSSISGSVSEDISNPSSLIVVDSGKVKSPEVYFGALRNKLLSNGLSGKVGEQSLAIPVITFPNVLYLDGIWDITEEYAENKSQASIIFNYEAKNVYMAAGATNGAEIQVYKDNIFIKKIMVSDESLYQLIDDSDYGKHILKILIPKSGLKAFTFTFG